jgi:hypothetical protein
MMVQIIMPAPLTPKRWYGEEEIAAGLHPVREMPKREVVSVHVFQNVCEDQEVKELPLKGDVIGEPPREDGANLAPSGILSGCGVQFHTIDPAVPGQ